MDLAAHGQRIRSLFVVQGHGIDVDRRWTDPDGRPQSRHAHRGHWSITPAPVSLLMNQTLCAPAQHAAQPGYPPPMAISHTVQVQDITPNVYK